MKWSKNLIAIKDDAYADLEKCVGSENISREPAVLDGYAWQAYANDDPSKWVVRPVAAILPGSTEEVQAIVKTCNKHGLKFKPFSTGWGAWNGCSEENVVQIDLRRMNRILEIDTKNMRAVFEPYVCGAQLQAEAWKVGLNTNIVGAGPNCSPLAGATSAWGLGHSGIYMSYMPRNVLGFEWVTPEGEIIRAGSWGSGLDAFIGDGPGPSLRGVIRGALGAFGGLGIFTKVSLKLYNWPGPPVPDVKGLVISSDAKIPDNIRMYGTSFPNQKAFDDAVHKMCEAEIGYNALRSSASGFLLSFMPRLFDKILVSPVMRAVISSLKYTYFIVLAGTSKDDLAYQEKVVRTVVAECGGICQAYHNQPLMERLQYINTVRGTTPALVFRRGGNFHTAMARNDALDLQSKWLEIIAEQKIAYARDGKILDDGGDTAYYVPYENGTWGHGEMTFQFDIQNEAQLASLAEVSLDAIVLGAENCMENALVHDPVARSFLSPLCGNFLEWQKKISKTFDSFDGADKGFYTKEEEVDLNHATERQIKAIKEIREKYTWTEDGPPRR